MIFDEKKHNLKNYSDIWDLSKQSFVYLELLKNAFNL